MNYLNRRKNETVQLLKQKKCCKPNKNENKNGLKLFINIYALLAGAISGASGPMMVSMILPVTTYGSALEEGRRSSK